MATPRIWEAEIVRILKIAGGALLLFKGLVYAILVNKAGSPALPTRGIPGCSAYLEELSIPKVKGDIITSPPTFHAIATFNVKEHLWTASVL